ncbi:MAG: histidinol dehydrogenase, partial [Clostridia bacterium]|nr:histidinol dehydrogenase [Clostridia bacterium]
MIKILKCGSVPPSEIFARVEPKVDVSAIVSEIIDTVRKDGDAALFRYAEKFDKATLSSLMVTKEEMAAAIESVEPRFLEVLRRAAENIRKFHQKQVRTGFEIKDEDGVIMGQKITPVDRAGLYVPGGTAAYPSTVLMDAIPAKIAGCPEVVMVTPPS